MGKALYIMIGGFLGAGKTTALARLGRRFQSSGLRAGLITNDQSNDLVDTALLRSQGFEVEEIAGGCFCCRFDSLHEAAGRLSRQERPDIFLAEPVGSCTDLVATVSYPLRRIYGNRFRIAPLSVMVDPLRAARLLGLRDGRTFSPKVAYVYHKQLEEADIIVVNKVDLVDEALLSRLKGRLQEEFPKARIVCCSARDGQGTEEWFELLQDGECSESPTMQVDYRTYAQGEALLGWLNCTVALTRRGDEAAPAAGPGLRGFGRHGTVAGDESGLMAEDCTIDGTALLMTLGRSIGTRLEADDREVAHLKMTLDPRDGSGQLAVVSLVRGGEEPELRASLLQGVERGYLIINLRAEADPAELKQAVEEALESVAGSWSVGLHLRHMEHFRPGEPVPVHRVQIKPPTAAEAQ